MKCVYGIINILTSKKYIGSTSNFARRKSEHLSQLRKNKHHSQHLQRAWNKYGEENFRFVILEKLKKEDNCYDIEQLYLDKYKPYLNKNGYNCSKNAKESTTQRGKAVYQIDKTGIIINEFVNLAVAGIKTGYSRYAISNCANHRVNYYKEYIWIFVEDFTEDILKMRLSQRTITSKHTQFSKNKMSISVNKAKYRFSKPVLQFTLNNIFIAEYPSILEASRITGTNEEVLGGCCRGKYKIGNGFIWKYKNN